MVKHTNNSPTKDSNWSKIFGQDFLDSIKMDEKSGVEKQPGLPLQLPILLGCLGFGFLFSMANNILELYAGQIVSGIGSAMMFIFELKCP